MKYAPTKRHHDMQALIDADRKQQNTIRWYYKRLTGLDVLRGVVRGSCAHYYAKWMKQFTTP